MTGQRLLPRDDSPLTDHCSTENSVITVVKIYPNILLPFATMMRELTGSDVRISDHRLRPGWITYKIRYPKVPIGYTQLGNRVIEAVRHGILPHLTNANCPRISGDPGTKDYPVGPEYAEYTISVPVKDVKGWVLVGGKKEWHIYLEVRRKSLSVEMPEELAQAFQHVPF